MAAAGPPLVGGAAPGRRSGAAWRGLAGPYDDDDGETAGSRLPRLDPASPGPDLRRAAVGAPRATPVSLRQCLSRGRKSLCSLPGPPSPTVGSALCGDGGAGRDSGGFRRRPQAAATTPGGERQAKWRFGITPPVAEGRHGGAARPPGVAPRWWCGGRPLARSLAPRGCL
jgi:hypothetical protein